MISRFVILRGRRHVVINGCVGSVTVLVFGLVNALRDKGNVAGGFVPCVWPFQGIVKFAENSQNLGPALTVPDEVCDWRTKQ